MAAACSTPTITALNGWRARAAAWDDAAAAELQTFLAHASASLQHVSKRELSDSWPTWVGCLAALDHAQGTATIEHRAASLVVDLRVVENTIPLHVGDWLLTIGELLLDDSGDGGGADA